MSNIYSTDADIESRLTPEVTAQIAEQMSHKVIDFETDISGFHVKKMADPTAHHHVLNEEIQSKIAADLTGLNYSNSGEYVILVRQPLEGHNVYRVIKFKVGENKGISDIKEIVLIELTETEQPIIVAEHVHSEEARVHDEEMPYHVHDEAVAVVVERVHSEEERTHNEELPYHVHDENEFHHHAHLVHAEEARSHEHAHNHQENHVSGLAAPTFTQRLEGMLGIHSADRIHEERIHE